MTPEQATSINAIINLGLPGVLLIITIILWRAYEKRTAEIVAAKNDFIEYLKNSAAINQTRQDTRQIRADEMQDKGLEIVSGLAT